MKSDDTHFEDATDEEATKGFIDIQFGLILILILALASAASGLRLTINQLRSSEIGAGVAQDLLLCAVERAEDGDDDLECGSDSLDFVGHDGLALEFTRLGRVLILRTIPPDSWNGLGQFEHSGGVFRTGSAELPQVGGENVVGPIGRRVDAVLPCFAPLDPGIDLDETGVTELTAITSECRTRFFPAVSDAQLRELGISEELVLEGAEFSAVDLVLIEGHSDGQGGSTTPVIGENRAKAVLLALLDPGSRRGATGAGTHDTVAERLAEDIDDISAVLDDPERQSYETALVDLVPHSARLAYECSYNPESSQQGHMVWCDVIGNNFAGGDRSASNYIPRIFALSSFGRFSLRHGTARTGAEIQGDARDRRIEITLRSAAVPPGIHDLVEASSDTGYYRLFTAAAVLQLHACDIDRAQAILNAEAEPAEAAGQAEARTCLERLDALVRGEPQRFLVPEIR